MRQLTYTSWTCKLNVVKKCYMQTMKKCYANDDFRELLHSVYVFFISRRLIYDRVLKISISTSFF